MNVYKNGSLRMDYNSFMNRISIINNNDWVSVSPSVFSIFCSLLDSKSTYDRVTIAENLGNLEIVHLFGNFILSYATKNFVSSVIIKENEVLNIKENIDTINTTIDEMRKMKSQYIKNKQHKLRIPRSCISRSCKSKRKYEEIDASNIEGDIPPGLYIHGIRNSNVYYFNYILFKYNI